MHLQSSSSRKLDSSLLSNTLFFSCRRFSLWFWKKSIGGWRAWIMYLYSSDVFGFDNSYLACNWGWTVGRWRKFMVMALYFNGQQAVPRHVRPWSPKCTTARSCFSGLSTRKNPERMKSVFVGRKAIVEAMFNSHTSIHYPPRRLFSLLVNVWYSEQPRGFVNSIRQVKSEHRNTVVGFFGRWAWPFEVFKNRFRQAIVSLLVQLLCLIGVCAGRAAQLARARAGCTISMFCMSFPTAARWF